MRGKNGKIAADLEMIGWLSNFTERGEWRAKGELAFPGKGARPQARLDSERIAVLERKIGQQTMEIDFLKKVLRRFKEHPLGVVANGGAASTSKSRKRPKRRPA